MTGTCYPVCGFKKDPPTLTCKNGPCQICVQVAKIDEEIKVLRDQRYDLLSEQNRVHDLMNHLPLELKTHIFEMVLPTRDEWGRRLGGKMPSYLTSICKGWRDIAWSTPSLWSTIPIPVRTTSDPSSIDFVRNWILRSRTLPLTLDIKDAGFKYGTVGASYDVLKVLGQYPNEWRSLSLEIPFDDLHFFDTNFLSRLMDVRTLRIRCPRFVSHPVSLSIPKMTPEKIVVYGLSFCSFQMSWNHLTSARVESWDLGSVVQLFQHASQLTYCNIRHPRRHTSNFDSMPPIIHLRLETLSLRCDSYHENVVAAMLLGFLALPCLRAIETNLAIAATIVPLVHRSSCPLTRITFFGYHIIESLRPDGQPLPGVTDLVMETVVVDDLAMPKTLLLEGYFPDLRRLTLPLRAFFPLWNAGVVYKLLGLWHDARNEVKLRKIFVPGDVNSYTGWDSNLGRQLKDFQLSISWREDGFEILLPGVVSSDEVP